MPTSRYHLKKREQALAMQLNQANNKQSETQWWVDALKVAVRNGNRKGAEHAADKLGRSLKGALRAHIELDKQPAGWAD